MPRHKITTLDSAKEACSRLKQSGKRIVFTNGCFDILHPGHTRYLCAAKKLGDALVVAVNSDASVRSIKGPKRPIQDERARAEVIGALECVDIVLIFAEDNPLRVIRALLPDVLVKGGDWAENEIVGGDVVKRAGGVVKRIDFETGFSTSRIIDTIVSRYV